MKATTKGLPLNSVVSKGRKLQKLKLRWWTKGPTQLQRGYPCQCRSGKKNETQAKGLPLNSARVEEGKTVGEMPHTPTKGLPLNSVGWKRGMMLRQRVAPKQCKSKRE